MRPYAGGAEFAQRHKVVAFCESSAALIQHERCVEKLRRRDTERAVNQQLAKGGEEQILAAHDFSNSHRCIMDDDGELISGDIIAPPDDGVEGRGARAASIRRGAVHRFRRFTQIAI